METNQLIEEICSGYEQDKYAMYLRKSRADLEMEALGEGETLARHKHMLEALAAKHDIHPDQITVYKEIVSGESLADRPEAQRLLNDVYAKKYKGVLVVEVERLARGNTKDQGEVADAFSFSSTHIITPAKVYDPTNEFDQEYFEFGLFMSRREYKTIRRRLESGKLESVKEGNYLPSRPPFGYDVVRESKKVRYLVPNPQTEPLVRLIFDWWTEDMKSCGWIANKLTVMGIPTYTKSEWHRNTISDILKNVHYLGLIKWNERRTVRQFDPKTGLSKVKVLSDPDDVIIVKGKHKAIISEEQFKKAQARFEKNAPVKKEFKLRNPFAGILRCCECNSPLEWMDFGDGSRVIRIKHKRSLKCTKKSLPAQQIIDAIVDGLIACEEDFKIKMQGDNDQTELIRHQETVKQMESELAKLEKRKQRLFDSWEADDGTYTKEEFIERKQLYTQGITQLKDKIKEAKASAPAPVNYEEQIINIHAMIECIRNPLIEAQDKNDFLKKYIDKITYDVIDFGERCGGKPILEIFLK